MLIIQRNQPEVAPDHVRLWLRHPRTRFQLVTTLVGALLIVV
jgi:hypothetical protein